MTDCLKILEDAVGGRMDVADLADAVERLDNIRALREAESGAESVSAAIARVSDDLVRGAESAALKKKLNAYQNIKIENSLVERTARAFDARKGADDSLYLGLKSAIVGINTVFEGSRQSIDALKDGMVGSWFGSFTARLRRDETWAAFNNMKSGSPLELEVATAIRFFNTKGAVGVPKVSRAAISIARAIADLQESMRQRVNRAGADIGKLDGFIGGQTHVAELLRKHGFDRWKADIVKRLDWDAMGIPATRRDAFLQSRYNAIRSGIRKEHEGKALPLAEVFSGSENLAKSISQSRLLTFTDAKGWLAYNQKYGSGSLRENMLQNMTANARNTAIMTRFGTNPTAMLDRVQRRLGRQYRDSNITAVEHLDGKARALQADMANVTGEVNIGAHSTIAKTGEWLRSIKTMAVLGGSWISSIGDVAFGATNRMYQGRSWGQAWGDAFMMPFQRMNSDEKRIASDLLGVGQKTALGSVMARISSDDYVPGHPNKLLNTFFKWNLLGPWTDANKAGATMMISRDLAMASKREFGDLSPAHKRLMAVYGIDQRQWNIARLAVRDVEGKRMLMPGDVDEVSGAPFRGLSRFQQQALKDKTRENLFALMSNEADFSSPTPGAREQSMMKGGYTPDTVQGQALRMLWQFKSFPLTATSKVMGRQVYGGGGMLAAANAIVGAGVIGLGVVQLKEVIKGREPRDWSDPKTIISGFLQGGALGLYGDFLLGEYNKYGRGMLESVIGPVGGDIISAATMFSQMVRSPIEGEDMVPGRDVLSLIKGNIPYANLFYTKMALDYLIWYQMQELLNPGYLRRVERSVKRRTGQEYWLPPSDFIQRGGGFK